MIKTKKDGFINDKFLDRLEAKIYITLLLKEKKRKEKEIDDIIYKVIKLIRRYKLKFRTYRWNDKIIIEDKSENPKEIAIEISQKSAEAFADLEVKLGFIKPEEREAYIKKHKGRKMKALFT